MLLLLLFFHHFGLTFIVERAARAHILDVMLCMIRVGFKVPEEGEGGRICDSIVTHPLATSSLNVMKQSKEGKREWLTNS